MKYIKEWVGDSGEGIDVKEIKVYFQEMIDDGWDFKVNSHVEITQLPDQLKNKVPIGINPLNTVFDIRGISRNIKGWKMGTRIFKIKENLHHVNMKNRYQFKVKDSTPDHVATEWDYETELKEFEYLADRLNEIKGRLEDDGYTVIIAHYDREKVNYLEQLRVIGAYVTIIKYNI